MPKPNTKFKLEVHDIDLIETALRKMLTASDDAQEMQDINELLGSLHNQKTWYRPPNKPYVSG
jgi:hypothetical protein